ncbi:MAG: hypothetical protein GTO24_27175, partial [candidate division Zixibacteria bacterium]|nr:hypothetical protein [candidate division Zixibacteria bacterium]
TRTLLTLGAVGLFVFFGSMLAGRSEVAAEPLSFDFTFTSEETVKVATVWDTVYFYALLTNTGTEIDSYAVTLTENPPTPEEWWVQFCAGGVCWDTTITMANSYLEPGWEDHVELRIIPRTAQQGNFTITVDPYLNPAASKSITFLLNAHEDGPVTNQWGLIILTSLILISGLYLMLRRYRLARQTSR